MIQPFVLLSLKEHKLKYGTTRNETFFHVKTTPKAFIAC